LPAGTEQAGTEQARKRNIDPPVISLVPPYNAGDRTTRRRHEIDDVDARSWINPFKGERQELVVYLPATSQLLRWRMICMLPAEAFGETVYKTFCHDRLDLRKVKFCDKITNLKV